MAPALITTLRRVVTTTPPDLKSRTEDSLGSAGGPLHQARALLLARGGTSPTVDPSSGVLDPHDINNAGFFALFALIGVAFVATGIWFFFWAKNGGFHFKQNDWDDYKTTVLRRRGPNGTLLSGATAPTDLGGGSVYKDVDDDGTTVVTESTALSGITAGASDIAAREKRKRKQEKRDRDRAKRQAEKEEKEERKRNKKQNRHVGEHGVEDPDAEQAAKKELRSYRHEKAARVGGLNKESDGSMWDGSTNPTDSTVSSELLSNREATPTSTPTGTPTKPQQAAGNGRGTGGIRKVYSVADRQEQRESERLRAEARRLRHESRSRRDFSYQRPGAETSLATESLLEGSAVSGSTGTGASSDLGTKSYHHPMPELRELERERERETRVKAREERRAARGGYRRGQTEDY